MGDRHRRQHQPAPPARAEVHLEELGQHSWLRALASTLTGSYGSAQFRFVARPPGDGHRATDHAAVGATFPVLRLQDIDDRIKPNAWIDVAEQHLRELDRTLTDAGWTRENRTGPHWWSWTYRRVS